MVASDNTSSAAAALRRLASLDEATIQGALSYMGREPFRRLCRAGGRTPTLEPSDDEGGSGPAGASSSTAFRLGGQRGQLDDRPIWGEHQQPGCGLLG